jgi:hypothetical protein
MILLSTLWVAWGEGGNVGAIADNLHWFAFASAVAALLVAGIVAGGLSGTPGVGPGLIHGVLVWGLVLIVASLFSLPQALRLFDTFTTPLPELGAGTLWATFFSLLIGLVAAAIGGLIGGGLASPAMAVTTPVAVDEPPRHGRHEVHSTRGGGETYRDDTTEADHRRADTRPPDIEADTGPRDQHDSPRGRRP